MKPTIQIVLPESMTAGEAERVVVAAIREAARIEAAELAVHANHVVVDDYDPNPLIARAQDGDR